MESEEQAEQPTSDALLPAIPLAAGLMWRDRAFLSAIYLLLVIPDLLSTGMAEPERYLLILQLLKRSLSLLFLYFVCRRWIHLLQNESGSTRINASALVVLMFFGIGFWILFSLPAALFIAVPDQIKPFIGFLIIPGIFIAFRYYFYFFPIVLDELTPSNIIQHARSFTDRDRLAALKVTLGPLAAMLLLMACAVSFSPDGRNRWFVYLADLCGGVFTVAATYLSLAFCLVVLSGKRWHELRLDPYREARFATISSQAPSWLAAVLKPRNGALMLFAAIMVWRMNEMRAEETPPAMSIAVESVEVQGKNVNLQVKLRDDKFDFRGVRPVYFHLAGEKGAEVALYPSKVLLNEVERSSLESIPRHAGEVSLRLSFVTERSTPDLVVLEDLCLWYRGTKVKLLDMKGAKVVDEKLDVK